MSHAQHATSADQHDGLDAWHSHSADEPKPQEAHAENIDAKQVFAFGIGGFVILVITIVLVIAYYGWYKTSLEVARVEGFAQISQAADTKRAQTPTKGDAKYDVIDQAKGVYMIPLDKAGEKVINAYGQMKR
jgi:hypothetical protein